MPGRKKLIFQQQYKPTNRQDEAVLRRNRRIELMKPVPVERLRFTCSCGAGDARADEALKPLPVAGNPAPYQETLRLRRGLFKDTFVRLISITRYVLFIFAGRDSMARSMVTESYNFINFHLRTPHQTHIFRGFQGFAHTP